MRKSGIFMHIASLPGPYGTGSLGKYAYRFVDLIHSAGLSYWQVPPLGPTQADAPGQVYSGFAGDPDLIDLDELMDCGLLTRDEVCAVDWSGPRAELRKKREDVLYKAFRRFVPDQAYQDFVTKNAWWLEDHALFVALKHRFNGLPWFKWTLGLMVRVKAVLSAYHQEIAEPIRFQYFLQYLFFRQWHALKKYANGKGIRIIGTVPLYVPLDSVDVWVNPALFQLDGNRRPKMVAGCPPSGADEDGQVWGTPLYNWDRMKQSGFDRLIHRLRAAGKMYDVVRLEHLPEFDRCWAVPATDTTAKNGCWVPGPGDALIDALRAAFPKAKFTPEELDHFTEEVRRSQAHPGVCLVRFGFDSRRAEDLPQLYSAGSVGHTVDQGWQAGDGFLSDQLADLIRSQCA